MGSAPSGVRRPTPPSAQLSKPAAATDGALSPPSAMLWQSPRPTQSQRDPVHTGEQLPAGDVTGFHVRECTYQKNERFYDLSGTGRTPFQAERATGRSSNR